MWFVMRRGGRRQACLTLPCFESETKTQLKRAHLINLGMILQSDNRQKFMIVLAKSNILGQ